MQRPFFDNKNSIWKILGLKMQMVKTCSSATSKQENFHFWKILTSRFLVEFQSFMFGQILANLGNFGHFWAEKALYVNEKRVMENKAVVWTFEKYACHNP
jgi:hypothetical protein